MANPSLILEKRLIVSPGIDLYVAAVIAQKFEADHVKTGNRRPYYYDNVIYTNGEGNQALQYSVYHTKVSIVVKQILETPEVKPQDENLPEVR